MADKLSAEVEDPIFIRRKSVNQNIVQTFREKWKLKGMYCNANSEMNTTGTQFPRVLFDL
jgi:hypothetical protein